MVVSDATRGRIRRDKQPTTNPIDMNIGGPFGVPVPHDTSQSSQACPPLNEYRTPSGKAYIKIDAFKNFMAMVTDSLLQQVMDHVERAVEETTHRNTLPLVRDAPQQTTRLLNPQGSIQAEANE